MTVFDFGAHPKPMPPEVRYAALKEERLSNWPLLAQDVLDRMRMDPAALSVEEKRVQSLADQINAMLRPATLMSDRRMTARETLAQQDAFLRRSMHDAGLYRRDLERVESVLRRVTYKPGWTFSVRQFDYGLIVSIKVEVLDVHPPHRPTTIYSERPLTTVPAGLSDEDVLRFLRRCIHIVEEHEADEWLKFDGKAPFDPHCGTQQ